MKSRSKMTVMHWVIYVRVDSDSIDFGKLGLPPSPWFALVADIEEITLARTTKIRSPYT